MSTQPDAAEDALVLALTEVIKGATSPEIQQAQALLLRRLATQGDVIPSRIPAPRNITEVGGYLNFLQTLGETQMRRDMLGSTLGLATGGLDASSGPSVPPLHLTAVANHRAPGCGWCDVPLSVAVREDLAPALVAALVDLRAADGMLPLWSPPTALPAPTGGTGGLPDPLPYLGRQVWVAPTAATVDPENDPVVLGRAASDSSGLPARHQGRRRDTRRDHGTVDRPGVGPGRDGLRRARSRLGAHTPDRDSAGRNGVRGAPGARRALRAWGLRVGAADRDCRIAARGVTAG